MSFISLNFEKILRGVADYFLERLHGLFREHEDRLAHRLALLVRLDPEAHYSREDLARLFRMHPDTVDRWIAKGWLPDGIRPAANAQKRIWTGDQLVRWRESLYVPGATDPIGARLLQPGDAAEE